MFLGHRISRESPGIADGRIAVGRLKVGVVGLGRWGRNLLRAIMRVENAEVTAVCDSDLRTVIASSGGFREPDGHIFTSFTEMLDEADIDAVIIATPPSWHTVHSVAALKAGKHVFVEKPMALNADGMGEVGAYLLQWPSRVFMVGHVMLYNDLVRWMKQYIDGGGIGEIVYATGSWLNWGVVSPEIDAFLNFGVHPVSVLCHLFGFPPQTVHRTGATYLQPDIDDVSFAFLRFGASVANLSLSWLSPVKVRRLFVVGEKASILLDDVAKELRVVDGDSRLRHYSTFGEFQLIRKAGQTLIPWIEYREPLLNEMEHFVHCCLTGEKPLTGFDHGAAVTKVMLEAVRL